MNQFIIHHNDAYQQDALSEYMKSVMICTVQSHTAGSLLEVVSGYRLLLVELVARRGRALFLYRVNFLVKIHFSL